MASPNTQVVRWAVEQLAEDGDAPRELWVGTSASTRTGVGVETVELFADEGEACTWLSGRVRGRVKTLVKLTVSAADEYALALLPTLARKGADDG